MGAVGAILRYGEARDLVALERWGTRLIALAENPAFRNDQKSDFSRPWVRLTRSLLRKGRHVIRVRRHAWWLRLANVSRDFPGNAEIQKIASDFDLTFAAQAAKGWPYGAPRELLRQQNQG